MLLSSGDIDTLHGADALFMKQLLTTLKLSRLKQDNFVSFVDIKTKLIRAIFYYCVPCVRFHNKYIC